MNELVEHFGTVGLSRWRLTFKAEEKGHLPAWLGSAWRGLLGHALKSSVCTTGLRQCSPCPLQTTCPYPEIFEPRPPAENPLLKRFQTAPAPYTLHAGAGGNIERGDELAIDLSIFGQRRDHAGLVTRALILGATSGIGTRSLGLSLQSLAELDLHGREKMTTLATLDTDPSDHLQPMKQLPDCPGKVDLVFETPLRLRIKNRYVGPDQLCFGDFFSHLLRRTSMLLAFYGQEKNRDDDIDYKGLVEIGRTIEFRQKQLEWQELARHSSKQKQKIPMGGVVGRTTLSGEAIEPLWPLIWLGQWLGVGKGVTMGLGRYRLIF